MRTVRLQAGCHVVPDVPESQFDRKRHQSGAGRNGAAAV